MANRIVLVSDDVDFFDYIREKLELRKSDELFLFSFDKAFENLHHFQTALFVINSENSYDSSLELLKLLNGRPAIVMAYNDDDVFRRKCYRNGAIDFMPLLIPDADFRARLIPALAVSTLLEKNKQFRDVLVENNILSINNDVYLDYEKILDNEIEAINSSQKRGVFIAIAPDDKTKFLLQPNQIETIILNNIRKNDILMSYATNKYFLLLFDADLKFAEIIWKKIKSQVPQEIYAGIVSVTNQKRQQLISEALNKLHYAIYNNKNLNVINVLNNTSTPIEATNFKQYRQNFIKKMEQIITPVFYQIQQKYSHQLSNVTIEQRIGDGYGYFTINGNSIKSTFNITSPGFSKVNIDIIIQKDLTDTDKKRITIEIEEFEAGLLEDLLEQFITEYKGVSNNDYT